MVAILHLIHYVWMNFAIARERSTDCSLYISSGKEARAVVILYQLQIDIPIEVDIPLSILFINYINATSTLCHYVPDYRFRNPIFLPTMPPKRKIPPDGGPQAAKKKNRSATSTPAVEGSSSSDEDMGDNEALARTTQQAHHLMEDLSLEKIAASRHNNRHSALFGGHDYSDLRLRPDHENRPLEILPSRGKIFLHAQHPLAKQAQDFLITIAEPKSRPEFIHEYKMTQHSLYAAVSVGLRPDDILNTLARFCKTEMPLEVIDFVHGFTSSFGKLKLVLKNTRYFLESGDPDVLRKVLQAPGMAGIRINGGIESSKTSKGAGLVIPGTQNAAGMKQVSNLNGNEAAGEKNNPDAGPAPDITEEDDDDNDEQIFSFQVPDDCVEKVLNMCLVDLKYPVLEEYDFRRDEVNPNLEIDLRPNINLRYYQEMSLSKMFGNGRAKSGIIVLPCGAGKTLVGITAACTIKKGCIVLCTSAMSAVQWRAEAIKFSNIDPADIAVFTSDNKTKFRGNTGIIVTTYSMVTMSRQRSADSQKMMEFLSQREWGLMLLDEVHVVPAQIFRKVITQIKTHCKLGLTATLLREDEKISDLNFLIGPKLYEANWMELSQQGHIAKVQCAEVWCSMTSEFFEEYLNQKDNHRKQELLYAMNPNKFQACQYLIDYHESRGDKIIVFSDNIFALQHYAVKLNKAFIFGETAQWERMRILENFQHNPKINTLFLSKIGDTSLDLPEATVLIQISSQYGSRRQEAQRLGRILRAKRRNDEGFNAFFYSLVSTSTSEMHYSARRQAFLVDQGYAFKVITEFRDLEKMPGLMYNTAAERRELLQTVLLESEKHGFLDEKTDDMFHKNSERKRKQMVTRRTAGGLKDLSGGQTMAYAEAKKGKKNQSAFFKKMDREKERRKKILTEESVPKPGQGSGRRRYN